MQNSFNLLRGRKRLCLAFTTLRVFGPFKVFSDLDTEELLNLLDCSPVDVDGGVLAPIHMSHVKCLSCKLKIQ
jgi:hypothetical protein